MECQGDRRRLEAVFDGEGRRNKQGEMFQSSSGGHQGEPGERRGDRCGGLVRTGDGRRQELKWNEVELILVGFLLR